MNDTNLKYDLLKKYTTSSSVIDELCSYTENKFVNFHNFSEKLHEEKCNTVWEDYLKQSENIGVFETLKANLKQLQFPIQKNISQSAEYRSATLKGISTDLMKTSIGLKLKEPSSLSLFVYKNFAEKIPVIVASNDEDFDSLIQALIYRNEPIQLPDSMGAALIKGLNNWDRIRRLKKAWMLKNPFGNWSKEFVSNVLPYKDQYQDKLIILSKKPYSNVASEAMNLTEEEWLNYSLKIRLEHECSHLYTLKTFGHMANNMHDELIADYMGITKVVGKFKSDWFLRFIGLENYPEYREGGRLQNYINSAELSEEAVTVLREILRNAAINLELFDNILGIPSTETDRTQRLQAICSLDLVYLSQENGKEKLLNSYHDLCQVV